MYIRIGILGRARQAMGIARLHVPKEALYIDVKYNSLTHSLRAEDFIAKTLSAGHQAPAALGMQQAAVACLDMSVAVATVQNG
jgi:hypothetical protein